MSEKELLIELCNLSGIWGYEDEVQEYILHKAKPFADEIIKDTLGNIFVFKRGKQRRPKNVVLIAHMDEVGFCVEEIYDNGCLGLGLIGGIDPAVCIGKRVLVGMEKRPGLICCPTELEKPVMKDLYVNFGAESRAEAQAYVGIGEPIFFDAKAIALDDDYWITNAIDDRAGCAAMLQLISEELAYDTWFAFSAGEEALMRGSAVVGKRLHPGYSLILEGAAAMDTVELPDCMHTVSLGGGAALYNMDNGTISNISLVHRFASLCEEKDVPLQFRAMRYGRTDAVNMVGSSADCCTMGLGMPARNLHSAYSIVHSNDITALTDAARVFVNAATAESEKNRIKFCENC